MSSGDQVELAAAGFIAVAIIIPVIFGLAFGIAVPLIGAMVRYRAHYRPRSVSLGPNGKHDEDEDMLDSSLPQATSLLGTLRRVKALEGWYGLYKGLYPILIMAVMMIPVFVCVALLEGGDVNSMKQPSILSALLLGVWMIASIPLQIITNRAILTPYRIPMGSMTDIKRVLLRPSEIANPFSLYTVPGILPVTLISTLLATVVAWGARWLIIGDGHSAVAVRAVLLILFRVISALCLVPLDVVSVRLSVLPRDDSRGELARVQLEDGEALLSTRLMPCSRGEAVIRMRTAGYAGLLDCAKTVAREEGKGALFRGWIWTLIGGSFSAMG